MSSKVGRNDPCPCGSGKKHKKCCLGRERSASPRVLTPRSAMAPPGEQGRFRMAAGSYSVGPALHVPAIVNLKRTDDGEWEYYFVLVNPEEDVLGREHARLTAARHLAEAFEEKTRGGSDADVALALRAKGYVKIDDFLIAESEDDEGFSYYEAEYEDDEGLGYSPAAQSAILEIVETQLRDDDPAEARQAFERLVRDGHPEEEAKRLIAALVAVEVFEIMKDEREFDYEGYVAALKRLPELPEDLDHGEEDA